MWLTQGELKPLRSSIKKGDDVEISEKNFLLKNKLVLEGNICGCLGLPSI